MQNTLVKYMYRDGSNYKFHGQFVVKGKLCEEDVKDFLFDSEFFIPHEIGLDHLLNLPMNQDDHYLHTFEDFIETENDNYKFTKQEFIEKLIIANENGWFFSLEQHWQITKSA